MPANAPNRINSADYRPGDPTLFWPSNEYECSYSALLYITRLKVTNAVFSRYGAGLAAVAVGAGACFGTVAGGLAVGAALAYLTYGSVQTWKRCQQVLAGGAIIYCASKGHASKIDHILKNWEVLGPQWNDPVAALESAWRLSTDDKIAAKIESKLNEIYKQKIPRASSSDLGRMLIRASCFESQAIVMAILNKVGQNIDSLPENDVLAALLNGTPQNVDYIALELYLFIFRRLPPRGSKTFPERLTELCGGDQYNYYGLVVAIREGDLDAVKGMLNTGKLTIPDLIKEVATALPCSAEITDAITDHVRNLQAPPLH